MNKIREAEAEYGKHFTIGEQINYCTKKRLDDVGISHKS